MAGLADVTFPLVESTVGYTPANVANEVKRALESALEARADTLGLQIGISRQHQMIVEPD